MSPLLRSRTIRILYLLFFALAASLNLPSLCTACWPDGPGPDPDCTGGGGDPKPDICPIDPPVPPGGCGASAANAGPSNRITYHSGNIYLTIPMFHLTTRGEPVSIYLTYNSQGEPIDNSFGRGWLLPYNYVSLKKFGYSGEFAKGWCLNNYIVKTYPDRRSVEFKFSGSFTVNEEWYGTYGYMADQGSEITSHPDGTFIEKFKDGSTFNYNTAGQLAEMIDANGNTNFVNFDESGKIQSIELSQSEISFIWEGSKVTRIVVPDSTEYSLAYADGNLVSYSTPEGVTTTFTYDGNHRLIQKNTEGKTVSYQYDNQDRVSARTDENGHTTYYKYYRAYTLGGEIGGTRITDPLGNYRIIGFDDGGRWTSQRWFTAADELIKEEQAFYGADGNLVCFIDGEGNRTTYEYDDDNGNRTARTNALLKTYQWEYDEDNNLIEETDPRGNWTEFSYDEDRNLIKTQWYIDDQPVTETRTYTSVGLLESLTNPRGYTTTYEYDDDGNTTKITEPLGKETTFTHDQMNRMLTKTEKIDDSTSRTTEYEYNNDGKRTKIIYDDDSYEEFHYSCCDLEWKRDRNGIYTYYTYNGTHKMTSVTRGNRVTEYEYDENNNLVIKTVYNKSYVDQVTEYAYDAANRLIEVKNNGSDSDLITQITYTGTDKIKTSKQKLSDNWITTEYYYDTLNRVTKVVADAPSGAETQYGYDANGNRTSVTDAEGRTTSYGYDERNHLVSITNDDGVVTQYTLDEVGNRTEVIQVAGTALERTAEYEYDALNLLIRTTDPLGNETEFSYNYLGNTISQTDANWNVTTLDYDVNGRLTAKTNAEGNTTEYDYDYVGNRTRLTDPKGNWTDFSYNQFNELIGITYADSSSKSFVYDAAGLNRQKTTRAGETIIYDYDEFGRLTNKTYPDSSTADFSYDQLGRMTAAENNNASYDFTYNDLSQLTKVDFSIGSESYEIAYTHDLVGNKTSLEYPYGGTYTRVYDDLNRLDQVKEGAAVLADYSYNDLNQRIRRDYLNTTWTTYTYNDVGRLTDLVNWRTETDPISSFVYTHDNVGNRLTMTTSFGTQTYSYDKIYEVTGADYPAGYSFPDETYHYDATWNRTTTVNGGTEEYFSNELNQYTKVGGEDFDYDLNGNLTTDGTQTYYYDCENQLTRVVRNSDGATLGEYKYDPFGKRIQKITDGITTNYIYDQSSYQVIAEYEDNGGGFELAREYIYGVGIDEPLVMVQDEERYFYFRDGLGSVTNLIVSEGDMVKEYDYAVYGDFTSSGSLSGNPYTFTGRRYDQESGLFYYRVRYYNSLIGGFLQVDPIDYKESINLYTYVLNSPTNYIDPLGKSIIDLYNLEELSEEEREKWTKVIMEIMNLVIKMITEDWNDKFCHCVAYCELVKEGLVSEWEAKFIGRAWEDFEERVTNIVPQKILDLLDLGEGGFEDLDLKANDAGITCANIIKATKCEKPTCYKCCNNIYPIIPPPKPPKDCPPPACPK